MKKLRWVSFCVLVVLSATQSVTAAVAGPQEVAEAAVQRWNEALRKGRIEDVLSLYAERAMLLQPGGQVARTPREIGEFWRGAVEQGGSPYRVDLVGIRAERDGAIVARLQLTRQGRTLSHSYAGEVVSVLRQQPDGSWKAEVQRWN